MWSEIKVLNKTLKTYFEVKVECNIYHDLATSGPAEAVWLLWFWPDQF